MHTALFKSRLSAKIEQQSTLKSGALILLSSLLMAISAQITIPLQPVPVTLQSFAAIFIGMAFGPKMSIKIILAYLAEGACGLPVFANFSGGIPILLGPTSGYLLGFIPAAALAGYLLQSGFAKNRITIFIAALLGTITLFIPGYLMLAKFIGWRHAYTFGIAPFYLVEICKLAFFTFITPFLWRRN
ncbi:MAG: biotin transporter BioY [Gammaproteobacteria bacterium]|jgi:biotin transport system substrate-specific component